MKRKDTDYFFITKMKELVSSMTDFYTGVSIDDNTVIGEMSITQMDREFAATSDKDAGSGNGVERKTNTRVMCNKFDHKTLELIDECFVSSKVNPVGMCPDSLGESREDVKKYSGKIEIDEDDEIGVGYSIPLLMAAFDDNGCLKSASAVEVRVYREKDTHLSDGEAPLVQVIVDIKGIVTALDSRKKGYATDLSIANSEVICAIVASIYDRFCSTTEVSTVLDADFISTGGMKWGAHLFESLISNRDMWMEEDGRKKSECRRIYDVCNETNCEFYYEEPECMSM